MRAIWAINGAILCAALAATALFGDAAAQEICENPAQHCNKRISPTCLGRIGAGAMPTQDCEAEFAAYGACLQEVAATCGQAAVPEESDPASANAAPPADDAKAAYDAVADSDDPALYELVAERYPGTFWGDLAAKRAASLRETAAPETPTTRGAVTTTPRQTPQTRRTPTYRWGGRYFCNGLPAAALFTVTERRGDQATGLMAFFPLPENPFLVPGCFWAQGVIDEASGRFDFQPTTWVWNPVGYAAAGMSGRINPTDWSVQGTVTGLPGCTTIAMIPYDGPVDAPPACVVQPHQD